MRQSRKIIYLERRNAELFQQNEDLISENRCLEHEIELLKKQLLHKDTEIACIRSTYSELKDNYAKLCQELSAVRLDYFELLSSAKALASKYKTEMKTILERMKKQ